MGNWGNELPKQEIPENKSTGGSALTDQEQTKIPIILMRTQVAMSDKGALIPP